MRIHLESKVLQSIAVPHRICRVLFGQADDAGILALVSVVLNNTLTNLGDMEKTVKEVGSPVEVCGAVGNIVAEHA